MPTTTQLKTGMVDTKSVLSKYTLAKHGRKRPVVKKEPRDRLIESLGNQIEIIHALQTGKDLKEAGLKGHKMFYHHNGRYIVQIRYTNTPLDLTPEADSVEVDTLEEVERAFKDFTELTKGGVFDEQINSIAAAWAAKLEGKRGRKPKGTAAEAA